MERTRYTLIDPESPPKAFLVMHRTNSVDPKNQIYTNDPNSVLVFMLGRRLSEYVLYVNDRIYDWPKNPTTILEHVKHCLEIDNAFYPPDEFPRSHWWE
jgi:hypothetical protein